MKSTVIAAVLLSIGSTLACAADSPAPVKVAAAAKPAAATPAPGAPVAEPAELPESSVEIFRIAPGQHEAFLKLLAETESVMAQVGLPPNQLYIHEDGANWDFVLIKQVGQDKAKWKIASEMLHKMGQPSGPDYFFNIRKMIADHTDTTAIGPTSATAYLGTRKAN
jgi:hypothetical protein